MLSLRLVCLLTLANFGACFTGLTRTSRTSSTIEELRFNRASEGHKTNLDERRDSKKTSSKVSACA